MGRGGTGASDVEEEKEPREEVEVQEEEKEEKGGYRMDPTNRDTEGWVQSGLRGMGRERRPGRLEYRGRG